MQETLKETFEFMKRWTDITAHVLKGKLAYFKAVYSGRLKNTLTAKCYQQANAIVSVLEFRKYGRLLDAGIYGSKRYYQIPASRRKNFGLGASRAAWLNKVLYPRIAFARNIYSIQIKETVLQRVNHYFNGR